LRIFEPLARGLATAASPGGDSARLTVLLFHRVLPHPDALMPETPDASVFDSQIAILAKVFRVMPLEDALSRLSSGTLPSRSLCITFDDGYRDNFDVAVPILSKHGATATFFIATGFLNGGRMMHDTVIEAVRRLPTQDCDLSWIGLGRRSIRNVESRVALIDDFVRQIKYLPLDERKSAGERLAHAVRNDMPTDLMMTTEDLRKLTALGMTIGAHTHDHPILSKVDGDEAFRQIIKSREVLADALGRAPTLFAYPNGKPNIDYKAAHVNLVKRAGFSAAVSVSMGAATRDSDHFQVPRFVPWDPDPRRLVMRILAHPWRHSGTPLAGN
jgi:peptidoglycan/xylan/chitin deacetylase (PgdA/CDA1 family)